LTPLGRLTTFAGLMLQRTPLHDFHVSLGAKMVDFAGWEMPLLYRGIVEEHQQTRHSGSLFDVSHMGRIFVSGPGTLPLLNKFLTRNVSEQRVGQSRYSLVCNSAGGILDDVIVSKDARHWLIVCNASNHDKIYKHLTGCRDAGSFEAQITDRTKDTAMVALQGPKVIDLLGDALSIDVKSIKRYGFENGIYMISPYSLFRSGYTGEDGVEIIMSAASAAEVVKSIAGEVSRADSIIRPAGLGARDTLRLEAAMPLYGHELSESLDPISAGLGWAVDLKKDFVGVEPLRIISQNGPARKLVGLELDGPRIARQGTAVKSGAAIVGETTSGTFGPTVQKSIAMAYVDAQRAVAGERLEVDLRGTAIGARVVPLPFYKRSA
jgi:aminomethyltransferase